MKKQLIIGIIIMLVCVGLSGCTNTTISDEERIIGIWEVSGTYQGINTPQEIWEFQSDHTFEISHKDDTGVTTFSKGTWKITNNKLILTFIGSTQFTKTMDYVFSKNYNTVTATDNIGATYVCNRQ